jgi:hypothetical protein
MELWDPYGAQSIRIHMGIAYGNSIWRLQYCNLSAQTCASALAIKFALAVSLFAAVFTELE